MYTGRRDIGNFVVFLGLILVFFVGYHAWLKPKNSPPVIPEVPPTEPAQAAPAEPSHDPPPRHTGEGVAPETPEPRLVALGDVPESSHAETLKEIRTLIELDQGAEAEAKLGALPNEVVGDPKLKPYVAVLWNNLGVLEGKLRGPATAIRAYKSGLALNPQSPALNLNLAHAYWETHDPALTQEFLEQLAKLVPDDPFPHLALADLLYGKDDLKGATRHLEMATARAQSDPGLKAYLEMVTAKVKGVGNTEQALLARESSHFVVKFDGAQDYAIWDEVLRILETAYREIGQTLGYFPSKPIHVVLLSEEQFHGETGTPAWADALFDPVLGRIKVPTRGALTDKAWLARVLRHEFVHALLHERMGLKAGNVPTWLNEGLAMQLAGDPWPDLDQIARGPELKVIPLSLLEGGWASLPPEAAGLAYLEANSATRYLIDRYTMERVRAILDRIKAGDTISGAIHDKLMITYEAFQKRWTNKLKAKLESRKT